MPSHTAPAAKFKIKFWQWMAVLSTAGFALVTIVVCIVQPDVLAALTLVPTWCWLVGGLGTVALCRAHFSRQVSIGLLAFWLFFACGWVEEVRSLGRMMFLGSVSKRTSGQSLRVASLNCAGTWKCADDLTPFDPDVVLLQEAPSTGGLDSMARQLYGDKGSFLAGSDTAILARGQIEARTVEPGSHFTSARILLDDGRSLEVVSIRLTPPVARLDFWSTAFWREHQNMRNTHRRELQGIAAHIADQKSSAIVIGGDFNLTPNDPALKALTPTFRDAFRNAGRGWGATGTNDWPLFRVDQIWSNFRLIPIRVEARKTDHSDHRAVICDFRFQ